MVMQSCNHIRGRKTVARGETMMGTYPQRLQLLLVGAQEVHIVTRMLSLVVIAIDSSIRLQHLGQRACRSYVASCQHGDYVSIIHNKHRSQLH